jgi:hypothetical protein
MSSTNPSGNSVSLPEAEEFISHGMPNYRVRGGKVFAMYAVNHHGDGRIALWLNTPEGMQDAHVHAEPKYFFVPPYVGPMLARLPAT